MTFYKLYSPMSHLSASDRLTMFAMCTEFDWCDLVRPRIRLRSSTTRPGSPSAISSTCSGMQEFVFTSR